MVYGQFHYAVDALAGLIVAGAVLVSLRWNVSREPFAASPLPRRVWEADASRA